MYTCVHGLSYVWIPGINFGYFSPKLFTVLRQGLLLDLELADLEKLASQCALGIHPFFVFPVWDDRYTLLPLAFNTSPRDLNSGSHACMQALYQLSQLSHP